MKVVVGTKQDLLNPNEREISIEEAVQFSKEINKGVDLSRLKGEPYFETSAKTGYNVEKVFQYMFQYCLPLDGDIIPRKSIEGSTVVLNSKSSQNERRPCCN